MQKIGIEMYRLVSLFLFGFFIFCKAHAVQPESNNYDKVVDTVAFKSKISGTTWSYKWRNREYIFSFDPNGSITKLDSWSNVTWSVKQPNEVILDAGTKKMYLFFNPESSRFNTVDWDGQRATGVKFFNDYQ